VWREYARCSEGSSGILGFWVNYFWFFSPVLLQSGVESNTAFKLLHDMDLKMLGIFM